MADVQWVRSGQQYLLKCLRHDYPAGFRPFSYTERLWLDLRALGNFCCSTDCLHISAALIVWVLVGYNLVWRCDAHGPAADLPVLSALLWLLPAFAAARRRALRRLLGPHWSPV